MRKNLKDYTWTCEDVAKALQYNVQYVRKLAAAGKLPAIKRRRQWLFSEAEIIMVLKDGSTDDATGKFADTSDLVECDLLR